MTSNTQVAVWRGTVNRDYEQGRFELTMSPLSNTRLQTDVALMNIYLAFELRRCHASPGAGSFGRESLGEGHAAEAQSR
jgi:hypothetical protein